MTKISLLLAGLVFALTGCNPKHDTESPLAQRTKKPIDSLAEPRERARSDDAKTIEEATYHEMARTLVITKIEPNKLGVTGAEFRVKRNPVGPGAFVYDPRTQFLGVERKLVWWVPEENRAYALNGPSKMLTPVLSFPEETSPPSTAEIVGYVFNGKAIQKPPTKTGVPKGPTFTVRKYRIYREIVDTPMAISEEESLVKVGAKYGMTPAKAKDVSKKVLESLFINSWFARTRAAEIRHASDWKGEQ